MTPPAPGWRPLVSGDFGDHRFAVEIADDRAAFRFSFAEPGSPVWGRSTVPLRALLERAYDAYLDRQQGARGNDAAAEYLDAEAAHRDAAEAVAPTE